MTYNFAESFVLIDLEPSLLCPKRPKQIWLAEWFSICLLLSPISALVTFAKQLMRVHLVALNLCLRHTKSRAVERFEYWGGGGGGWRVVMEWV